MAFKLTQESGRDLPTVMCDVCGNRIYDLWGDLVSGSLGGNLIVHHKACVTTEPLHTTVAKFFGMLIARNRIGDLGSDGTTDKITLELPTTEGFVAQ